MQTFLTNPDVFLIAGLGNPGREYKETRHNVGFMALDRLAARLNERFSKVESRALITRGLHQGKKLILAKPQTYMNESGSAVGALARFYKIDLPNLLVIYDDVDLPFGALRMRPAGGSAGQKGMKSIIERLGSENFPRLRIGIGRPPGRMDAAAYVLQPFDRPEAAELPFILDRVVDAIFLYTLEGLEKAMTQYNGLADKGSEP